MKNILLNVGERLARKYLLGPAKAGNALLEGAVDVARRATESAGSLQRGGSYDPAPVIEGALMTLGSTPISAPRGAVGAGPGIRAYHGSPHDFDRFDLSKIGTGEGAQVYGHGLYFAENPKVAQEYRTSLSQGGLHPAAQEKYGPALAHAKAAFERSAEELTTAHITGKPEHIKRQIRAQGETNRQRWDEILDRAEKEFGPPGHSYEVNIRARPEEFVDWEKLSPAAQQELRNPESVRRLAESGYPGVRYLDQGSRSAGNGTSNYVLFRDDIVDILRKYGLAGALGPAAVGNALLNTPSDQ